MNKKQMKKKDNKDKVGKRVRKKQTQKKTI